tara:strand:+ start:570 stop:1334 length:765 start_codon:yes stop_codon:yes gene_type:complete
MSLIDAVIIGLVQGVTEFLPISSSGHLVIFQHLLKINLPGNLVEVAAHFGTLCSIILIYWKEIIKLIIDFKSDKTQKYILLLIVATLPSIIFVLFAKSFILEMFESIKSVSIALIITGLVLLLSSFTKKRDQKINFSKGLLIGIAQAFAIIPGISRSGMTISTALYFGVSSKEAAKFSFLLAIPAILGAIIITAIDSQYEFDNAIMLPIILTSVVSFISGYFALKILIRLLEAGKFYYFAYYCLLLGIFTLIIA